MRADGTRRRRPLRRLLRREEPELELERFTGKGLLELVALLGWPQETFHLASGRMIAYFTVAGRLVEIELDDDGRAEHVLG